VERAKLAGITKLTPHGLRHAAGRRLAEEGCTANEIAAILGHSTLAMVQVYTRSAAQESLAKSAMVKLEKSKR
jgi:integrase